MKSKYLAAVLALVAAGNVVAENIALTDPSLENAFGGTNGSVVSGWFTFGAAVGGNLVTPGSFWNFSNPDGSNAAYAVNIGENDGGTIYQTVELDANVTYTLTVAVGMSSSVSKSDGKFALVFFNQNLGSLLAQTTGSISTRGSFADYSVQFTPTTTGLYQVGMRNRGYVPGTGANNNESTIFFDNVRLTVGGSVVYPASIDVSANDATTVQPITVPIDNGTAANLEITGIEVTGPDSSRFSPPAPATPFNIAPGAAQDITFSFTPGGIAGPVDATLEITSNDPNSPFLIPIGGFIRDPRIDTVATFSVPPLASDAPVEFDITVNNLGTLDLEIDGAFLSGPDASYFEPVTDFTDPLVIPGGESEVVTFRFDPEGETRTFSATIELDSNDPGLPTRFIAATAQLLKPNPPALSLRLDGNSASIGGGGTGLIPIPGAPFPAEVIDNTEVGTGRSTARNFYYDSDGDLAFTSPGDTSGNTDASLEVDVIVSGPSQVLNFYVDTDGNNFIPDNFAGNFYRMTGLTITLSDGSKVPLDVTQGTPQTFSDPDEGTWSVAINGVGPLTGETTDIVGNIDSVPDGDAPDYHFTLTFSYSATSPGFASWADSFGIPDDPDYDGSDNDGVPALVEYALGLSPLVSEPSPGTFDGTTLSFTKGAEAVANGDVTYAIQTSQTLEPDSWTTVTPDIDNQTTISYALPSGQGKIFARLLITRTP